MVIKSIITDQLDMDFERALQQARKHFEYVEIHSLWGKTVETLTDEELTEAERLLSRYRLKVSCLSTTLFLMCPLYTRVEELEPFSPKFKVFAGTQSDHFKMLERAVQMSVRLNAPTIRVFPFRTERADAQAPAGSASPGELGRSIGVMAEIFSKAAAIAEEEGKVLVVENCPHSYLPWGVMTYELAEKVGREGFRLLYDAGNSFRSEKDSSPVSGTSAGGFTRMSITDEYEYIKDKIMHLHFKDYKMEQGKYSHVPLGDGDVGFADLYGRISAYNKDVCVSLEPEVDYAGVERSITNFLQM